MSLSAITGKHKSFRVEPRTARAPQAVPALLGQEQIPQDTRDLSLGREFADLAVPIEQAVKREFSLPIRDNLSRLEERPPRLPTFGAKQVATVERGYGNGLVLGMSLRIEPDAPAQQREQANQSDGFHL